eukprot:1160256-Pelagomonas_calceolata.AAC.20
MKLVCMHAVTLVCVCVWGVRVYAMDAGEIYGVKESALMQSLQGDCAVFREKAILTATSTWVHKKCMHAFELCAVFAEIDIGLLHGKPEPILEPVAEPPPEPEPEPEPQPIKVFRLNDGSTFELMKDLLEVGWWEFEPEPIKAVCLDSGNVFELMTDLWQWVSGGFMSVMDLSHNPSMEVFRLIDGSAFELMRNLSDVGQMWLRC